MGTTDVVVVGAGIAGITSAHFLQKAGYSVTVFEEKAVGSGATGESTGVLWYGSGLNLTPSIQVLGKESTKILWQESEEVIKEMGKLIRENNVECEWRSPGTVMCANDVAQDEFLQNEARAMQEFGYSCKLINANELKDFYPASTFTSGLMEDCSQINPAKFVTDMTKIMNINVKENSPMIGFEQREQTVSVKTRSEEVKCSYLVVATNYKPFFNLEKFWVKESTVALYSQPLGEKLKEIWAHEKIFWTVDELYDMIYPQNGRAVLELYRYREVEAKLKRYFPNLTFQISEQRGGSWAKSKDTLPFLGQIDGNIFAAIAMGDQGIVMGVACGRNIVDALEGRENGFLAMTSPSRLKIMEKRRTQNNAQSGLL